MPELPDVEVFRRYLKRTALHHRVVGVSVRDRTVLDVSPRTLARRLSGHRLDRARRHGKFLLVELDDGGVLVLHFGMTGFLERFKESPPEHARVILDLDDGSHLAYDDQRMFGEIDLADDADRYIEKRHLGPDALSLDREAFVELLRRQRGTIKSALMNQHHMAGIGNIYSDEILFHARLHPETPVRRLDDDELRALHRELRRVVQGAIAAGADPARMPRGWLLPHRSAGESCPRCKGKLSSKTVRGRTSWFCPACQKRR